MEVRDPVDCTLLPSIWDWQEAHKELAEEVPGVCYRPKPGQCRHHPSSGRTLHYRWVSWERAPACRERGALEKGMEVCTCTTEGLALFFCPLDCLWFWNWAIWAICTKQRACVAHVQHVYSLFSLDHVVAITCILELSPGRILLLFPTTCADVGCDV